jgi:predicted RNA-binding protein with PUA-like domain
MNYWLLKTEPNECSIDDIRSQKTVVWDGIRNYKARNYLRDDIAVKDQVFIYHSSCADIGIAGIAIVVKKGYPDPAQFDPESRHYDAKSTISKPRWYCIDIQFRQQFGCVIALSNLKKQHSLQSMMLLQQPRLSVQPVSSEEFDTILILSK